MENEPEYLFFVTRDWINPQWEIVATPILKETKKTVRIVGERASGYRSLLSKDSDPIHRTEKEALEAFIKEKRGQSEDLQSRLGFVMNAIEWAEGQLEEKAGDPSHG